MRKDYKRRQCAMMIKYADDWTIDRTYSILLALMRIREKNIGKGLTNGCSCDRIKQTTVRKEGNDSGRNAD
jgi:hypothetical protein